MKVKLLSGLIMFMLFSCSKDDTPDYDANSPSWDLSIENVYATQMQFQYKGYSIIDDYDFGIRKKDDTEIYPFPRKGNEIGGLEPLTEYDILVYNTETKEVSDKKLTFQTLPFDLILKNNNYNSTKEYLASHEGVEHAILLSNISKKINSITAKLIPEESKDSSISLEDVRIENDSLYFTIPEDIIPNDPYEAYRIYNLEYTIGDKSFELESIDWDIPYDESPQKSKLVVYNSKPQILSINISKNEAVDYACSNIPSYEIGFVGAFMNVDRGPTDEKSYGYIDNARVRVYITEKATGNFFFVEKLTDLQKCAFFIRNVERISENPFGLNVYHRVKSVIVRGLESPYEFHPGEFSARIVFERGDEEFFETNEYSFTITE